MPEDDPPWRSPAPGDRRGLRRGPDVRPPQARHGTPSSQEETGLKTLWEQDAQRVNALYGEALNTHRVELGLPAVENVRDHVFTRQRLLAADPVLRPWQDLTDLDLVQTGAWLLPDERPLPEEVTAFVDSGTPPVYVRFDSMALHGTPDVAHKGPAPTKDSQSAALTAALDPRTGTGPMSGLDHPHRRGHSGGETAHRGAGCLIMTGRRRRSWRPGPANAWGCRSRQ